MNLEQYLLTLLVEECAEVAQRATKAQRFGMNEVQPGQDLNNFQRLNGEINDLMTVMGLLQEFNGYTDLFRDEKIIAGKTKKILKFATYSAEQGTIDGDVVPALRELIEQYTS